MSGIDEDAEKTLLLAVTTVTLKNLCELLISKGIITAEEYKKIVDDANNGLQKAFMEE